MIYTDCYFAVLKKFKEQYPNAIFELIMRRFNHPLSPSWKLLTRAKTEGWSFSKYKVEFLKELNKRKDAKEKLKELKEISREHDLFLICFEKDASVCHRSIIKELLEKMT